MSDDADQADEADNSDAAGAPPGPGASGERAGEKPAADWAGRLKARIDAVSALLKALLLLLILVLVGGAAAGIVWRELSGNRVEIVMSDQTESALRALGVDADLRYALVDALNERIRGARQIVELQGAGEVEEGSHAADLSLETFGVRVSTNDLVKDIDEIFGRPADLRVRFDLLCAPTDCASAKPDQSSLLVSVIWRDRQRTVRYPLTASSAAVKLNRIVERTADLALEQRKPLVASVYFLNRAVAEDKFPDQSLSDLVRAEADAIAGRADGSDCLADLVIGVSLMARNEFADGVAATLRARSADNPACKINADTNIVFQGFFRALCGSDEGSRREARAQITEALKRMHGVDTKGLADLVFYRIPAADTIGELVDLLWDPAKGGARFSCPGAADQAVAADASIGTSLEKIIDEATVKIPPAAGPAPMRQGLWSNLWTNPPATEERAPLQHGLLLDLWQVMEVAVPQNNFAARLSLANAMNKEIDAYLVDDAHPRWLFFAKGKAEMEIVRAKMRLHIGDSVGDDINSALVAFENAAKTTVLSQLLEPVSDVEIDEQIGDLHFEFGSREDARAVYEGALDKFIEAEEPTDQVLSAANVLAKLASLRMAAGACKDGAPVDRGWDARWSRLGGLHDVCKLMSGDEKQASQVEKMVVTNLRECGLRALSAAGDKDGTSLRIAFLGCPSFRNVSVPVFRFGLTASNLETELGRALEAGK